MQSRYQIEIRRDARSKIFSESSSEQIFIAWPDEPLRSREQAEVRVRVSDLHGTETDWSEWAQLEAGLLDPLDWTTGGIRATWEEDHSNDLRQPAQLRREFILDAAPRSARLYVTAHGLYEMEINGQRVGDEALAPGWTVYPERLRYRTLDVTHLLREGTNAIGAWLGDGWYRGRIGFDGGQLNTYGTELALLAQLEVTLSDGSTVVVGTDSEWRARRSPIVSSSLYTGETYDRRQEKSGWSQPGLDDADWSPVAVAEFAFGTLVAPEGPPVRCTQELGPVSMLRTPDGTVLVDFGQNFAGRIRIVAPRGVAGELSIRHAEVLQDGELYARTLRAATSVDRYLGSEGAIDWEPRFTIHGFRYAEIAGYAGELEDLIVIGRAYHSDMARTGWLETSDPELNRLHENIVWSLRSNFVDIPTDCPQRDERLGWTGDIQVFAPTASYLFECDGFLRSWLTDLQIEQRRFGTVPWYVPVIPGGSWWTPIRPGAVWGDVAVLLPAVLWDRFSDRRVLESQYDSARTWVDQVARLAGPSRLWNSGFQLGDWLDPTAPPDDPAAAITDKYLVATAYFAWSTRRLSEVAATLDRHDDAHKYARLAEEIRSAFRAEWTDGTGRMLAPTQTGYSLAICFNLLDPIELDVAGGELARLVRDRGNRIGAGFAGVNLVADALTVTGNVAAAYDLLMEQGTPSWLSMVRKGATTIWERWDSLLDDGTVNPGGMTSFNHYALGSIGDWMHRVIGGIAPTAPGYQRIKVAPTPGPLNHASARFESPYGLIATSWRATESAFELTLQVPAGVDADVELPDGQQLTVGSGTHQFTCATP